MLVRIAICLALLGGASAPLLVAVPAYAVTMDDVRQAMAEKRSFDAFQYLKELAEAGDAEAQYELAGFYHWGKVTAADFTKARQWYERAARQGNADAMLGLAVIYGHGQGVPQDKAASYRWLVLASSQHLDSKDAARIAIARDDLAKHLSAQQIEAALAEARSFVPQPE
ncbi:tetratricopeptide repeat protein [Dongia deserti]|uniref:tetratricopeptide repeat protein n=1 Tax=Dongia deserti TaxID=2268030 RepID=UPI000E64DD7F|nr:tetratricopeptide repeat protein [Dongia deserti]